MRKQALGERRIEADSGQVVAAHGRAGAREVGAEGLDHGHERLRQLGAAPAPVRRPAGSDDVEQVVGVALRALGAGAQRAQRVGDDRVVERLEGERGPAQQGERLADLMSAARRELVELAIARGMVATVVAHGRPVEPHQPGAKAVRRQDGLAARAHAELAQHGLDVRAHGLDGEHELVGDVVGRAVLAEEVEDLPLARGQRAVDRAHAAAVLGDAAHALDQAHGEPARDDRLAVAGALQRARQGVEADALAQEARGAGAQRHDPDLVVVAGVSITTRTSGAAR